MLGVITDDVESGDNMDKADKTAELVILLSKSAAYAERSKIDDRTYELDGKYLRFHDVSTDGVFYGFKAVDIPNPTDAYEAQLEALVEIYSDEQIVKGCVKSIVIELQQAARKVAVGDVAKMPDAEFKAEWNRLTLEEPNVIQRLKTYEYIEKHIRLEWLEAQPQHEDGTLRLF